MFGGSGKMGRGGGGGGSAGKRNIHAPPINRAAPTGRLSLGGGPRGRGGASSAAISSPSTSSLQVEESFSLIRENPLNFGMAIKMAPDLVEEMKRVEAQGGMARIKFDANPNNPNGNIIHVGDKAFKFTWSREPGDLCDIYEERRSGEDGNGLLVESGGTWRKLNVERELDESTKNHVKRRSEEAERKHKSRKAIILDHQNPSMKNQMKALAAAESNQWRNFKHRKEPPFKKPKSEPPSGGPPKSAYKSGSSTTFTKSKLSSGSPFCLQQDQHVAPASPIGSGNLVKGYAGIPDVAPIQTMNKTASLDKEMHSRLPNTIRDKSKHNRNLEAKPADLRSLLISLLQEHQSKGMSIKGLEKAIGEPNSAKKIEPILKQIATLRAPGRYFLKPGLEMESFKKPPSQIGSSPEINRHQSPEPQKFGEPHFQDPSYPVRTEANDEEQGEMNTSPVHIADNTKKISILNSPENSDKKVSDNNEELQGSSSDSGSDSDSDSDSSDSGSDTGSHSRSKSRSPAGSRSGSSSDSESDASSSSKQAPDEDVNILSDDDKEPKHKLGDSDPISTKSLGAWSDPDNEYVDIENDDKQDDQVPCVVEIEKDSPEDVHVAERPAANYPFPDKQGEEPLEKLKPSSADHLEREREVYDRKGYDGPDSTLSDGFEHDQSGEHPRLPKGKSKRRVDDKHSDERAHNRKKLKSKNSSHPVSGTLKNIFGDSPDNLSPDRPIEDPDMGPIDLMVNRTSRDGVSDPNLQIGFSQVTPGRAAADSQQLVERSFEDPLWTEVPSGEKRPGKYDSLERGVKFSERSVQTNESVRIKKGLNAEAHSEDGLVSERRPAKFNTESVGDKHATMTESHYRKPEMPGKVKDTGPHSNSHMGYSPKDNNTSTTDRFPVINGRGGVLRREHSDLELGEFREPCHDETPVPKKQFERKSSFKQWENTPMDSECWNSDFSRGKPANKINADAGTLSPPNSDSIVASGVPDGPSKRKASKHQVNDLTRSHHKGTGPLHQHHKSWGDHIEVGSQHNKVPEMSSKSRFAEGGSGQGASSEAHGDTSTKVGINSAEQQHGPTRGVAPHTTKESKKQKPNLVGGSNDRRNDSSLTGSNEGGRKKKESSSDENSFSYTKYEKDQPELKGPIKDVSQYKEYVKEYQEKYESYCSLNKILESYRDDFSKLGKDLEAYKGRDMKRYHDILEEMRSSFRQCGERHKRLKKIFVVLYEELKHLKQMIKDYAGSYKKD